MKKIAKTDKFMKNAFNFWLIGFPIENLVKLFHSNGETLTKNAASLRMHKFVKSKTYNELLKMVYFYKPNVSKEQLLANKGIYPNSEGEE